MSVIRNSNSISKLDGFDVYIYIYVYVYTYSKEKAQGSVDAVLYRRLCTEREYRFTHGSPIATSFIVRR